MLLNNPGAEQIIGRLPAWIQRWLLPCRWIVISSLNSTVAADVVSGKVIRRVARVEVVVYPLLRH